MENSLNKVVLVTGGAGSLGKHIVSFLKPWAKTIRIFDNDEYGLYLLQKNLDGDNLRFLLGDVRDRERVKLALDGVDCVIHAAAVKNIEISEYNVPETVRTNVEGTINLVENSIAGGIEKFLFISSDKAVDNTTLYGATKFVAEKTVLWASKITEKKFAVFRQMNFKESRGNVFELWKEQNARGEPLTITDVRAKRFFIPTMLAAELAVKALEVMTGGEIFVPQAEEYAITDLAKEMFPDATKLIVGLRYPEKLREELMTDEETTRAEEKNGMWVIRAK